MFGLDFLLRAVIAGLIVAIIAYIAEYFVTKAGFGFPRMFIWLIALVVWLIIVFNGGVRL